jgi:serine/threonine protein kinase
MPPQSNAFDPTVLTGIDSQAKGRGLRACPTCGERFPADFKLCPRDGAELGEAAAGADADPLVGAVVNATYEITSCIGEGGMARVYEATHRRIRSRRLAIKVLNADLARFPEVVARFEREAVAAAQIDHPGVVSVHDVGHVPDGRPFIAYERLDGADLGDVAKKAGKLGVPAAVGIVRQAARALEAAHARGVVHRDVKPENLFVSGTAVGTQIKILDFGISKVDESLGAALTQTGSVLGTPAYMSPEQARGDKVDFRTDIYSLGAVLYRLATGARPFEGVEAAATISALLTSTPARPRAVDPDLPEALEIVIQRAMAERPADRYSSMAELDAALAPFDTGEGLGELALEGPAPKPKARSALERTAAVAEIERSRKEARAARPTIIAVGAIAFVCAVLALADAAAAGVRALKGGDVTAAEGILILIGVLAGVSVPVFLILRGVIRGVWSNTARAVELAHVLRNAAIVALAAYGVAALVIRFTCAVMFHHAVSASGPGYSLLLAGIAVVAGAIVVAVHKFRRRR